MPLRRGALAAARTFPRVFSGHRQERKLLLEHRPHRAAECSLSASPPNRALTELVLSPPRACLSQVIVYENFQLGLVRQFINFVAFIFLWLFVGYNQAWLVEEAPIGSVTFGAPQHYDVDTVDLPYCSASVVAGCTILDPTEALLQSELRGGLVRWAFRGRKGAEARWPPLSHAQPSPCFRGWEARIAHGIHVASAPFRRYFPPSPSCARVCSSPRLSRGAALR